MKKALSILLCLAMTLSLALTVLVLPAGATVEYGANDDETCRNGEASIDVTYTNKAPTLDGVVEKNEYTQIPNDVLCDFYTFYLGDKLGDWSVQDKLEYLRDVYTQTEMSVYANWDGKYLYFAVVATAPFGEYTCPKAADSVNMFRYWCLQCACAAPDAYGMDRYEIGLGAPSDESALNDCYLFDSWGQKVFRSMVKGEDYFAHWDTGETTVTYELRFNIKEIIGHMPQEGDQMRFLYLLSQSGQQTQNAADTIQIQSAYGCAMEKRADQFLMLNFVGAPEDATVDPAELETEITEEELDGYWGKTDFRYSETVKLMTVVKALDVEEKQDDNGDRYIRLTATGENPNVGGPKLPIGLNADSAKYMAFRYRTSSPAAKWFGISYQSMALTEESTEYLLGNYDELICDGQWHTVILYLSDARDLSAFMTDLLIWPFVDSEEPVKGSSMDLMWIKYYTEEPYFEDETAVIGSEPIDDATETVAEPIETEDETIAEQVTGGNDTVAVTDVVSGDNADTGCQSVIALPVFAVLGIAVFGFCKKKEQ